MKRHIIVIGGGAAGLMAAGCAARAGADVLVLEKMARPGRKLGISGKGRCNLTNVAGLPEFIAHFGKSGKFLHHAFSRFFSGELIDFFEGLGVALTTERGGRVFPAGAKAPDVVRALVHWAKAQGVQVKHSAPVDELVLIDGRVTGVVAQGLRFDGDAVILATGGASYPGTGSTGDGYRLAAAAGHSVVPIRPALVPLETAEATGEMAGLTLKNVGVRLLVGGKKRRDVFGEMCFTEFGVAGPLILTLSGEAVDALGRGETVQLAIDLKPALEDNKLDARLRRDFAEHGRESMASLLRGLLPSQMIPVCLDQTAIAPEAVGNQVTAAERTRLRQWLKGLRLTVTDHRPLDEAIITAGGVDTREVDPKTMQSRLAPGLYFAGEILDLQADTGGYNLQAAFSTGWLAGTSAAVESRGELK
ncbi:MAG: NAD(P)/FAD-dependent oxidoreductase [Candidatus Sumerlaeia bacterium]